MIKSCIRELTKECNINYRGQLVGFNMIRNLDKKLYKLFSECACMQLLFATFLIGFDFFFWLSGLGLFFAPLKRPIFLVQKVFLTQNSKKNCVSLFTNCTIESTYTYSVRVFGYEPRFRMKLKSRWFSNMFSKLYICNITKNCIMQNLNVYICFFGQFLAIFWPKNAVLTQFYFFAYKSNTACSIFKIGHAYERWDQDKGLCIC